MKKIFTLVSIAFCAMSVNAQEVWKAAEYNLESATLETLTNGSMAQVQLKHQIKMFLVN